MKKVAVILAISRVVSAGSAFLSILYLAKTRQISDVGNINALMATIQIVALVLALGLPTAIIYFAKGRKSEAAALTRLSCLMSLFLGGVLLALNFLFFDSYADVVLASVGVAMVAIASGYAQSLERYAAYGVMVIAQSLCFPFSNYISLGFLDGKGYFYVYALLLWLVFMFFMQYFFGRMLSGILSIPSRPEDVVKPGVVLKYGLKSLHFNSMSALYYSLDVLLIKHVTGGGFLGAYSIAANLAKSSWLVVDSVGQVVFPRRVAGTLSDRDFHKIVGSCVAFSVVLCVGWYFVGEFFLSVFFGGGYKEAYLPCLILLIGSVFLAYYKLKSRLLAAENRWFPLSVAQVSGMAIGAVLIVALSGELQGIGAALGQSSGFIWTALVVLGYKRFFWRNRY